MSPSSPASPTEDARLLVVMRHGRAEPFAAEDHRRRLTDRGARDSREAGEWLARKDYVPTYALVSSAARTQATWESVRDAGAPEASSSVEDALYSADPLSVVDLIRSAPADAAVVLYVGHNPTAASLAHLLDSGEPDGVAFRALSQGFPTSALAVLRVPVAWSDLDAGTAHLVDFHVGHGSA